MRANRIGGGIGYATIMTWEEWEAAKAKHQDRRLAQIPTEHHRRESDCVVDHETGCCGGCGRPMNETERGIYRAL